MSVWITPVGNLFMCATDDERTEIDENRRISGQPAYEWSEISNEVASKKCGQWQHLPEDVSRLIGNEHVRLRAENIGRDIFAALENHDWEVVKYLIETGVDENLVSHAIELDEPEETYEILDRLGYSMTEDDVEKALDELIVPLGDGSVDYMFDTDSSGALRYAKKRGLWNPDDFNPNL